jgi:hypothetical protein
VNAKNKISLIFMKKITLLDIFIIICSKWWLLVPISTFCGALFAFAKESNTAEILWVHVIVGAIWGAGLGLLTIPLSLSKTRIVASSLFASLIMTSTIAATGLLLNWSYESIIIGMIVGALIGIFARWWAPQINLL